MTKKRQRQGKCSLCNNRFSSNTLTYVNSYGFLCKTCQDLVNFHLFGDDRTVELQDPLTYEMDWEEMYHNQDRF